jgi:hypothetical protein
VSRMDAASRERIVVGPIRGTRGAAGIESDSQDNNMFDIHTLDLTLRRCTELKVCTEPDSVCAAASPSRVTKQ